MINNIQQTKKVIFHQNIYNDIIQKIKQKGLSNKQHFLVTGKNGMGKTFLLKKVYEYTVEHSQPHQCTLYFASEQFGINRLHKFWKLVCQKLSEIDLQWKNAYFEIKKQHDYEQKLVNFIKQQLKDNNQSVVLIINNFDSLIQKFSILEQHQFRELLLESSMQIIGSSNGIKQNFGNYDSPFFDFFRYIVLSDLDWHACLHYFGMMAQEHDIKNYLKLQKQMEAKLFYLFLLSDKTIRQIAYIFELIFIHQKTEIKDILGLILDKVNLFYQLQITSLAPLQQEIIFHMATIWERCSVSDLEKKMNLKPNAIAGQLKLLEEQQLIKSRVLIGFERLKFYEIEDRCFNFWIIWNQSNPSLAKEMNYYCQWIEAFHQMDQCQKNAAANANLDVQGSESMLIFQPEKFIHDLTWDPKVKKVVEFLISEEFQQAEQHMLRCLQQWKSNQLFEQSMVYALLLFYQFKQKHFLLHCFDQFPFLKEHSKPLYFWVMQDFKKEFPKKYQRMAVEFRHKMA